MAVQNARSKAVIPSLERQHGGISRKNGSNWRIKAVGNNFILIYIDKNKQDDVLIIRSKLDQELYFSLKRNSLASDSFIKFLGDQIRMDLLITGNPYFPENLYPLFITWLNYLILPDGGLVEKLSIVEKNLSKLHEAAHGSDSDITELSDFIRSVVANIIELKFPHVAKYDQKLTNDPGSDLPEGKALRLLREKYGKDGGYGDLTLSSLRQSDPKLHEQLKNYAKYRGIPFDDILPKGEELRGAPRKALPIDPGSLDPNDPRDQLALRALQTMEQSRTYQREYKMKRRKRQVPIVR